MIHIITIILSSFIIGTILGLWYFGWFITKNYFNHVHYRVFNLAINYEREKMFDMLYAEIDKFLKLYKE
jgi:hypothetical protein